MIKISGQDLNLIGAALANEISKGKTADELNLLGAFFNLVGDAISVISAQKSIEESKKDTVQNKNTKKQ